MENIKFTPYKSVFSKNKFSEDFIQGRIQIALEKAVKVIGRRLGTKLYLSIIPQSVIKGDGRKLSGLIATFDGNRQIRFNWKTVDSSNKIVGVDIWNNVKTKLFKPDKELVFDKSENILQIIDAVVQGIRDEKSVDAVIKIVESEDRLREDAIVVDPKTQGKVSAEIKRVIDQWSEDMDIDTNKLINTRFSTLWNDYLYWKSEINTDATLKVLNYGSFRNYLLAIMEKHGLQNIFMRQVVSKAGTKEKVIVTDEIEEKNFNAELYKLTLSDQFELAKANINQVLSGKKIATCVSGLPGLGKTRLVRDILGEIRSKAKIVYLKGGVSKPIDLFDKIVSTNGKNVVCVMDDFDIPFIQKKQFESLLKAMFDPTLRILTYIDSKHGDDKKKKSEIKLDSRFIIITNVSKDKMDSAVESRLNPVEISGNAKEVLDYMHMNLDNILPQFKIPRKIKIEVLDFLYSILKNIRYINFRVFEDALRYRYCEPENPLWKKFVFSMVSKSVKY